LSTPLGATFLHWVSRRALRWLYRDVHYMGRERVPVTGPVLLLGNHPNDLPDVLAGLFITERHVRYVATLSATVLPLATASYKAMGVIPVMRVRDVRMMRARGVDVAAVNAAAFETVRGAFAAGDVVAIFPEGGVHDTPFLGVPRSGVSRMALLSIDDVITNDLTIVPFGLQYEAPRTLRSDLTIEIGEPFSLASWHAMADQKTGRAVETALSAHMHRSLLAVTRNSSSWEHAEFRDRLTAVIGVLVARKDEPLQVATTRVQARCAALVEPAEPNGDAFSELDAVPPLAVDWRVVADPLGDAVVRAGGIRTSARDTARALEAAWSSEEQATSSYPEHGALKFHARWPSKTLVAITAVPAVIGLLLHAPLWFAVLHVAKRMTVVRTDYIAKAILPGLHLILLGYLILGGLSAFGLRAAGWSMWWALALLALLPRLGDLGVWWHDAVGAMRLRARVRGWSAADRAAVIATAERIRASWSALS
jgi:1-acyl-sn-glycerol-3-phosphate acyltransferase